MIDVSIIKKLEHFTLDFNVNFDSGVLVLQGESGAGKTTILNCIAGLIKPDKGIININENTMFSSEEKINIPTRDRNIGYLFQNYALFPHMSVRQNILYGLKSKHIKDTDYVDKIIETFKIGHIQNRMSSQISGGEKQRTALARAMATKPNLLLLDEPFSALDSKTKKIIYEEFIEFKKNWNVTSILITHDENEAMLLGDKVIRIEAGGIV